MKIETNGLVDVRIHSDDAEFSCAAGCSITKKAMPDKNGVVALTISSPAGWIEIQEDDKNIFQVSSTFAPTPAEIPKEPKGDEKRLLEKEVERLTKEIEVKDKRISEKDIQISSISTELVSLKGIKTKGGVM